MDVQDIRLVVQAMEARPSDIPSLLPGTISEVSEDGSTAVLVMDSDPDGITVQARMLFADLGEGDRAMVMFDPPRGVYVVGTIGRRTEAGQIVARTRRVYTEENPFEAEDLTEQAQLTATYIPGRLYRIDFTFTLNADIYAQDPSWVYGAIYNDEPGGIILPASEDFFIGISPGGATGFATVSSFRIVETEEKISETLNVYLYPTAYTSYTGWFEVAITDAGPTVELSDAVLSS
jgi:hypothetical protein